MRAHRVGFVLRGHGGRRLLGGRRIGRVRSSRTGTGEDRRRSGGQQQAGRHGHAQVFLSHPSGSTFRAFSPSCTHQGCTVDVQGDKFVCPCHGSEFALADGAVLQGPANTPLIERKVTVTGGTVYLA
ncbi:Rieske (2Fe-2S) protein [Tersicoccus sp. MR15.9]|uniref:Rieske (2Fe-2S) protein n=1 Tax=Tersicoccus mangrovi TaxID=3121635 RepID=UPI002FE61281